MRRTDRITISVTVADLRAWLHTMYPDLPTDCLIETHSLLAPDANVAGMMYDDQTAVVVTASSEFDYRQERKS